MASISSILKTLFPTTYSNVVALGTGAAYLGNKVKDIKDSVKNSVSNTVSNYTGVSESDIQKMIQDSISSSMEAYSTSALKAEEQAVKDQQAFIKSQNDLAWERSQSSAREQMEFQKAQADLAWERSLESANAQMAFQENQLKSVMDYETMMSSTAYQRAVKDLKSAGLNPILAVTNGSASTPSVAVPAGASASAQAMSGASASASAGSSSKADYSRAKEVDIASSLSGLLTSAGKLISKLF